MRRESDFTVREYARNRVASLLRTREIEQIGKIRPGTETVRDREPFERKWTGRGMAGFPCLETPVLTWKAR